MSSAAPALTDARGAVLRLVAFLVVGIALAVVFHAINVLVVVIAIIAMVMLHELGHFLAAKWSGMKVTEYFFGFGPRLWSVRRGETEYGVKAIPAGGYVRIPGMTMLEEVSDEDEPRSYRQATFPRRIAVAVAGSTMHILIALVLCFSVFVLAGAPVATRPYVDGMLHFLHGQTPAERAGLRNGDIFVSIDGVKVTSFASLDREIRDHVGQAVPVVVERDGHIVHLTVTPVSDKGITELEGSTRLRATGAPHGIIGVELTSGANRGVGFFDSMARAAGEVWSMAGQTFQALGALFSFHGLSQFAHTVATANNSGQQGSGSAGSGGSASQPQFVSILGVIQIGSQAASQNIALLLLLLAEVNVFIGIVNLFPMLPLDGGHVAIAVYERIRSRKGRRYHADVLKLLPVAYLFLALVVLLGVGALYVNIVHPAHLPPG